MSRWNAYLNTGQRIVEAYDGRSPLSAWLKDFFRQHKQMGSRDRKIISELVYCCYRLGHSAPGISMEDKLLIGLFICNHVPGELLGYFKPDWNVNIHLSYHDKATFLESQGLHWQQNNVFPWQQALSVGIDTAGFNDSHLSQPDLFLRIRPGMEKTVTLKLNEAGLSFTRISDSCIALPNGTQLDKILVVDREFVIQDYNSQRVGAYFPSGLPARTTVWDCCAGSGGKSIMAHDLNPATDLYVSDSRASIIQNLKQRFHRAGINSYTSFVTDLALPSAPLPKEKYDFIIADVPCSGSGTWSRTPEQLAFFEEKKIQYYSGLQRKIISMVVPSLKKGGRLAYITCSVFREENEDLVEYIKAGSGLRVESMQLLKGYDKRADTLFITMFSKD